MHRYIIKRLLLMIPVIIGVSFLVFFIMDLAPGDAVDILAPEGATAEDLEAIRHDLGLDQPVIVRYVKYMGGMLHGDMGVSYVSKTDVFDTYMEKLPATIKLSFASILVSILLSVPLGIYSATRQGTVQDNISMIVAMIGLSMPNFWLGLMLIVIFAAGLGWFPSSNFETWGALVLPAVTLSANSLAMITRMTRSSMLETIRQDYIRTARAKGLKESVITIRHALRNAMIPIVTTVGLQFGFSLGGAVLVETVFSWPGIGRLLVDCIGLKDTPVVVACVLVLATMFTIINLCIDILYAFLDPRIRAQYKTAKR